MEQRLDNAANLGFSHSESRLRMFPSKFDTGRALALTAVLSNKDAFNQNAREIQTAAMPTLEKRAGQFIKLSTANGFGNSFEEEWHKAEKGESVFHPIFLPWTADPSRTQAWCDDLLEKHGQDYMWQEYPKTPRQAFLASGRPFFDIQRIDELLASDLKKPRVGYLDMSKDRPEIVEDRAGALRIYELPREGGRYVAFADVAEGLEHGDWSVWQVEDIDTNQQVAMLRIKCDAHELAHLGVELGTFYNDALLSAEANGLGVGTVLKLAEPGYYNLAWKQDPVTNKGSNRIGHWTDATTRRAMLTQLQGDFRTGAWKPVDEITLREMANMVHRPPTGKPQAEQGCNDDTVMAAAGCHLLAVKAYYEIDPPETSRERLEQLFGMKIFPVGVEAAALREQREYTERHSQEDGHWRCVDYDMDPDMEEV